MKRILVTGGAGFIGSHTVDLLLEKGYEVRILDSLQERVHPRGWPAYLPPDAERVQGDVGSRADWERALAGIDGVFHLAAYQDYMPDFSSFFQVNTVSTALLFEIIVEQGLPVEKVVLASSQAVYGEGKYRCPQHGIAYPGFRSAAQLSRGEWDMRCPQCGGPMEHQLLTEDAVNPHTAYGISKYALELASHSLGRKYGIPTVNMRYSIVQGPRQSFYNAYSGACRVFCLNFHVGDDPPIYEDGGQVRDFVNYLDVVDANLRVLHDDDADYEMFHVGGEKAITVCEFASIVAEIFGRGDYEPKPCGKYRFGDTRHIFSDVSKLKKLGWKPRRTVQDSVDAYRAWLHDADVGRDILDYCNRQMAKMNVVRAVE